MITVPESFWNKMLDEFEKEPREVEQVAYLDGVVFNDTEKCTGAVTTLTIPNAELHPGRFRVAPEAMSEAGKHFRRFGLQRLAQVHTHPTEWVGHSGWDDEWAYSQAVGAISIVLPEFGRSRPSLPQAGVHLRTAQGWQQLSVQEVERRLRIIPSNLDFRKQAHEPKHLVAPRRRRWWHALAFWRDSEV